LQGRDPELLLPARGRWGVVPKKKKLKFRHIKGEDNDKNFFWFSLARHVFAANVFEG